MCYGAVAEGACIPSRGIQHEGTPVTALDGEVVGFICIHCLLGLKPGGWNGWHAYSDSGIPLPELPCPCTRRKPRRKAHRGAW